MRIRTIVMHIAQLLNIQQSDADPDPQKFPFP